MKVTYNEMMEGVLSGIIERWMKMQKTKSKGKRMKSWERNKERLKGNVGKSAGHDE